MSGDDLIGWVASVLLLSLRVAPVFAFAPPFTLVPMPRLFRMLFGLGIAALLVGTTPAARFDGAMSAGPLLTIAARELLLGIVFVLAFQLAFAALQVAGRLIDIQAGFGLATLVDPTTKAQMPLVGTIFAYVAGAIFFGMDGHVELLAVLAASVEAIPLGTHGGPTGIGGLTAFVSIVFLLGLAIGAGVILALFIADLAIALLSRTVPQMNVLVLGFQVKTLLLLLALPLTLAFSATLLARLMRITLESLPGLI